MSLATSLFFKFQKQSRAVSPETEPREATPIVESCRHPPRVTCLLPRYLLELPEVQPMAKRSPHRFPAGKGHLCDIDPPPLPHRVWWFRVPLTHSQQPSGEVWRRTGCASALGKPRILGSAAVQITVALLGCLRVGLVPALRVSSSEGPTPTAWAAGTGTFFTHPWP